MRFLRALAGLVVVSVSSAAVPPTPLPDGLYADLATPRGIITVELFYQKVPLTVASFVGLAEGTLGPSPRKPFFNGLKFHRVVPHFVIQGGDPLGTGEGGPGYSFPDEFAVGLRHDDAGILSMANDGPDTNGSQFFITLAPVNRLNYLYSVFGRVVRGREIPPLVQKDDVISAVTIHRIGASAQAFRADQAAFDALVARTPKFTAPPIGPGAYFDDPDHVLPADPSRAQMFQQKLANFERITGKKSTRGFSRTSNPMSRTSSPAASPAISRKRSACRRIACWRSTSSTPTRGPSGSATIISRLSPANRATT